MLSIAARPEMAQHPRAGGRPAQGHMGPHPGNGGMHPADADRIQRQIEQQNRQYLQQVQGMQQQAHEQYQSDLKQFDQWLKANGHSTGGSAASQLPNNPIAFDAWAQKQQELKAGGRFYDPLYDRLASLSARRRRRTPTRGNGRRPGTKRRDAASRRTGRARNRRRVRRGRAEEPTRGPPEVSRSRRPERRRARRPGERGERPPGPRATGGLPRFAPDRNCPCRRTRRASGDCVRRIPGFKKPTATTTATASGRCTRRGQPSSTWNRRPRRG